MYAIVTEQDAAGASAAPQVVLSTLNPGPDAAVIDMPEIVSEDAPTLVSSEICVLAYPTD